MVSRQAIHAEGAPPALGPYSHAIVAGGLVFTSGQLGLDPLSSELVGPDIKIQTRQVLDNLKCILEAGGSSLEQVVRVRVYLTDLNDFAGMNEVVESYFPHQPPARACVGVASLPKGALVEMDAIGVVSGE